jgi:hypothetical protein
MALRPGARDKKLHFLITGEELAELKRHADLMTEAFGLDRRIEKYQGKRPICQRLRENVWKRVV